MRLTSTLSPFRHFHDAGWKDYRATNEIENPAGEWHTIEVIADGDRQP